MFGDGDADSFKQARYFDPSRYGLRLLGVVLHDAECTEVAGAAVALENYDASMGDGRVCSWNYAVDDKVVTQNVMERQVAYHAPPVNGITVGVEMVGYSSQTIDGWSDPYSSAVLERAAQLVARICKRNGLPIAKREDYELVEALSNAKLIARAFATGSRVEDDWTALKASHGFITTHAQVSRAFAVKGGHTDPGMSFPFDQFLVRAAQISAALSGA